MPRALWVSGTLPLPHQDQVPAFPASCPPIMGREGGPWQPLPHTHQSRPVGLGVRPHIGACGRVCPTGSPVKRSLMGLGGGAEASWAACSSVLSWLSRLQPAPPGPGLRVFLHPHPL